MIFNSFKKNFLSKRLRFVLVSSVLTLGLILLSNPSIKSQWIYLFAFLSTVLADTVLGGAVGIECFGFLTLPLSLALGAGFSQYFFPNFTTVFRVAGWISFFLAYYATLLATNVFKVARIKGQTIPLVRAARPAFLLLNFVVVFLLLTALHKASIGVGWETLAVFLVGFFTSLSFLWCLSLTDFFLPSHLWGAFLVGIGLAQVSIAFAFYPWKSFLRSLAEAAFFYALLGVARTYFEKHLKYSIVIEYIATVLAILLLIGFF